MSYFSGLWLANDPTFRSFPHSQHSTVALAAKSLLHPGVVGCFRERGPNLARQEGHVFPLFGVGSKANTVKEAAVWGQLIFFCNFIVMP